MSDINKHKENLLKCVNICKESYNTFTLEDKKTDTQLLIKDNIICWRGTENIRDWCTNLKAHKNRTSYGRAHSGFLKAYNSLVNQIPKNKKVIITGHSLGGALATLNGIDFLEKGIKVEAIYTFGQPRCLSIPTAARIKRRYKNKFYRCVHNNDIVPRVPPRIFWFGHLGEVFYFDKDRNFLHDANWKQILVDRAIGRVEGRIQNIIDFKTDGIADHDLKEYGDCIIRI